MGTLLDFWMENLPTLIERAQKKSEDVDVRQALLAAEYVIETLKGQVESGKRLIAEPERHVDKRITESVDTDGDALSDEERYTKSYCETASERKKCQHYYRNEETGVETCEMPCAYYDLCAKCVHYDPTGRTQCAYCYHHGDTDNCERMGKKNILEGMS